MYRNPTITKSAKGQGCTMHSPMCNYNPETTVWCHSDFYEHGKGVGLKAHDIFGFYGCSGCHHWLDTESKRLGVSLEDRKAAFRAAMDRSLLILVERGILK